VGNTNKQQPMGEMRKTQAISQHTTYTPQPTTHNTQSISHNTQHTSHITQDTTHNTTQHTTNSEHHTTHNTHHTPHKTEQTTHHNTQYITWGVLGKRAKTMVKIRGEYIQITNNVAPEKSKSNSKHGWTI